MAERENIRSRLKKHQLTQVWLINQLGLRGIVTDKTEMSSVLAGTRSGSKADAIIELSHDILDAPDCCRGLWLVYKVIIILFYSSQSCRRWCFTCKAVNLCHRDIKRCITSRFVGCTVVIFKRI